MALVDTTTGVIVSSCSPDEARQITDEIKGAAERVWSLLLEAHERGAWSALGYGSWRDYAMAEFGMSQSHAYRLLDQARVVAEIESVAGSPMGETISERAAREIKPRLKAVTDSITKKLADEAIAPDPERVKELVDEAVVEQREKAKQQADDDRAVSDLAAKAAAAGMDMDKASLAERGGWSSACRDVAKPGDATAFVAKHRPHLTERHIAQAERAYCWLDEFLLEVREDQ